VFDIIDARCNLEDHLYYVMLCYVMNFIRKLRDTARRVRNKETIRKFACENTNKRGLY
jgi:hypothetical protein